MGNPRVVRKEKRVVTGELYGGYGFSSYRPVLDPETEPLIIDDEGNCALPTVADRAGRVTMTVEITTWSDQRTNVRCVSIQ